RPGNPAGAPGVLSATGDVNLGGPFIADVSSAAAPAVHAINDAGQHVDTALNNSQLFVTDFRGVNDVTITATGHVPSATVDSFPASPGNNPAYLSNFIGSPATGTGDGTLGRVGYLPLCD